MSPDLQWHVSEDADQETIVKATPPRRSRRSWIAVLIAVVLGVSLGVLYRSLPEPIPQTTPLPSPTPVPAPTRPAIPAALYQTIDHEAQALADGDFETYLAVHTSGEAEGQGSYFTAWGRPTDDRPLYTIIDFNVRADRYAWADIRQFRAGGYFRETRFYRREEDRWLRSSRPDVSLWSGQEAHVQTPHFDVTYAIEDRAVLSPTLHQLEEDYQALCRDLGCAALEHELTFTLQLKADQGPYSYPSRTGTSQLLLPSPRVAGFFETGRAYRWNSSSNHFTLANAIVERLYGAVNYEGPGGDILGAGILWAIDRTDPLPAEFWNMLGDLSGKPLLPLQELWGTTQNAEPGLRWLQTFQLLRFVEQEYGAAAIARLLETVKSAKSLPELIEKGIGVPFTEFDQKWQAWATANITTH